MSSTDGDEEILYAKPARLTKREYFAFEFAKIYLKCAHDTTSQHGLDVADAPLGEWSVEYADELIKALNEEKK